MDEKALKTSVWQRVIIVLVAVLLLGSTVLTYMFIVMSGDNSKKTQQASITELQSQYTAKAEELAELAEPYSDKYFSTMDGYKKSQVKSYNATTVNNEKLKTNDLKVGDGRELTEGDVDYSAYYIGWCADGSIFDSSFTYADDDTDQETPIGLSAPLVASTGLIEGWTQGVIGMKLGGVREIAMAGELAYADSQEICGGTDSPLKFVVMALETDPAIQAVNDELNEIYFQLYSAMLGGSY